MTNNDIREAIIAAVRHDLELHTLSDRALPQTVRVDVIYPTAHSELVVDLKNITQGGHI